jgi:DNA topoisomerase-1
MTSITQSPYTLVVCEKPDAARRIAHALGNSSLKEIKRQPPVFSVTDRNNQQFVVCSAIGHLYGLVDAKRNRSVYPVFDVKWVPILKKTATRSEQIVKSISLLSQKATKFVHACDYDQEGEVIGYNILQYACNNKYENSLRAKFSTLTDEEIRNSFDNLLKPSKGLAEAGR